MDLSFCLTLDVGYWWVFFVAAAIAAIANASGLGGGPFFSPFFIIILQLSPGAAVGTTILTKAFGTASGAYRYNQLKLIDFPLALKLLVVAVPLAIFGSFLTKLAPVSLLQFLFAFALLFIAYRIFKSPKEADETPRPGAESASYAKRKRILTNSYYTIADMVLGWLLVGTGAFLEGMISLGLGPLNDYFLIAKSRIPAKISVATSIFVLACVSIASTLVHLSEARPILEIAAFTIPGAMAGAQIGAWGSSRINPNRLKKAIAVVMVFVSLVLILKTLFLR